MRLKWVNINTTTTRAAAAAAANKTYQNTKKKRKTSKDTSALTAAGHTENDNKWGNKYGNVANANVNVRPMLILGKDRRKDPKNKTTRDDLEPAGRGIKKHTYMYRQCKMSKKA